MLQKCGIYRPRRKNPGEKNKAMMISSRVTKNESGIAILHFPKLFL